MPIDESPESWSSPSLGRILCDAGVWDDDAPDLEPVGDGNINWVRRLRSHVSGRTVIVKHARPALEKFPEYQTSTERIVFENRYYEIARRCDDGGVCPGILYFDAARRLLVLEDLQDAERLDAALGRAADVDEALVTIAGFLGRVHGATWADEDLIPQFANAAIRKLHGNHIFTLPYEGEGFPVPAGVEARAAQIRDDPTLAKIAAEAYRRYLDPRGALVHADVQPGNVLLRPTGPTLLDAEIAHVGDPAFDIGTLLAHLWLARITASPSIDASQQTQSIWAGYVQALGVSGTVLFADVARYAGLEMMRRTIGAARVPAVRSAEASLAAIDLAQQIVRQPPATPQELPIR